MNNRIHLLSILLGISFFLVACGPSQGELNATETQFAANIFATQTAQAPTATATFTPSPTATLTPTPTLTPTATPTDTPTPTLTPTPGLSSVALTLDDLPPGFESMSETEVSSMEKSLPEGGSSFGFSSVNDDELIMGILMPAKTKEEQASFDAVLPQFSQIMLTSIGITAPAKQLSGIDNIGEARSGVTAIGAMGSITYRWDVITFRRSSVVVVLIVFYPDGNKPIMPIVDLAQLLDERISISYASLNIVPVATNADMVSGLWTGTAVGEGTNFESQIDLNIKSGCGVGSLCGMVSARAVSCSGDLKFEEYNGIEFVFIEENMSGSSSCVSGGREYLRLLSNGSLFWRYEYKSPSAGTTVSKGVFKRP